MTLNCISSSSIAESTLLFILSALSYGCYSCYGDEYSESLCRAAIENAMALRRFDICVSRFEAMMPRSEALMAEVGTYETTVVSRLIVDYDQKKGFLVRENIETRGFFREEKTVSYRRIDRWSLRRRTIVSPEIPTYACSSNCRI